MADDQDGQDIEALEEVFEAPEKGSAEELLDARAGDALDPMRHSAAHVMAEAVLDLFPGTKLGIGPAIDDGFYYDFQLDRPIKPDDLAAIEERMAASVAADHPFVREELPPEEGRAFFAERDQPFKVEILDDLRRQVEGRRVGDAADDGLRARPVRRPVPRPARREHGQDRPVQAPRGLRRVLARRPVAARAPARLRDGLVDAGGARQVPLAARGGEEARPPPPRRPARPVLVPRRLAGRRVLAPEGLAPVPDAAERDAREPGEARLRGDLHAAARPPQALGAVGPLGALPRLDVPARRRRRDVQPQADELPGVDVHLPLQGPLVPRPATPALGVRRAPPERAIRRVQRPHAGSPLRHGRRPHLRPAGPDRRRDRGAHRRDPRVLLVVRPGADASTFGTMPDKAPRRPGDLGGDRGDHAGRAREVFDEVPGQAQGRRVLRPEDRHPGRGRPGPGMADGDDPGRPTDAARAVRPLRTSTRRAASSARWRSTARSTARWSGSSAC